MLTKLVILSIKNGPSEDRKKSYSGVKFEISIIKWHKKIIRSNTTFTREACTKFSLVRQTIKKDNIF